MKKILIIDDEEPIRKMLKLLLENNGYTVNTAVNGEDGLRVYRAFHPDLIITDLIMPEKEGLETIQEIRQKNPDVKIIAISGGGIGDSDMYLHLAKKIGADHSIAKPVHTKELLSIIDQLLIN